MTNVPQTPPTVASSPQPTAQELALEAVQWGVGVAGALGVALPPAFTSLAGEQQVAGLLLMGVGLAVGLYRRFAAATRTHNSAVASARAGTPLRALR